MRFDAIKPGPPLDVARLQAYCSEHGLDLPRALRAQLLDQNGGAPRQDLVITIGGEDTELSSFFGVAMPEPSTELATNADRLRGRIPDGMFAFADDAAGNVFLIESGDGDDGTVWFWDHEREGDERALVRLESSLPAFLTSLGLAEDRDANWMQLTIRRATPADASATAELYLRARRAGTASGTVPPPAHGDDEVRDWVVRVVIPAGECWLAENASGTVLGMLVLEEDWIDQLYVDPELTGAGIGSALIAVAKRERPDGLRLWTFQSNRGAQRFYRCHGFHEAERTDGSRNEERAPDVRYVWRPT